MVAVLQGWSYQVSAGNGEDAALEARTMVLEAGHAAHERCRCFLMSLLLLPGLVRGVGAVGPSRGLPPLNFDKLTHAKLGHDKCSDPDTINNGKYVTVSATHGVVSMSAHMLVGLPMLPEVPGSIQA